MKKHFLAAVAAGGLGAALLVMACTGDDPALPKVGDTVDGASSSGTNGASGDASADAGRGSAADSETDALATFDASAALVVFVHSGEFGGDFGGLGSADQYCQTAAMNYGLPNASTAGSYKAWMADATQSPASRFKRSLTGYKRVDNAPVATSWEDLTDGTIANPINVMENGGTVGSNFLVWTNVSKTGTAESASNNCGNWATTGQTGGFGDATQTTETWSSSATRTPSSEPCNNAHRLFCVEQQL